MSKIIRCFLDADLRNGREGLADMAKKSGIAVSKLEPGQYVIFINAAKTKLKLYASDNVVAYLRTPENQRIALETIPLIPRAFQGSGRIDYDKALKETLTTALAKRVRVRVSSNEAALKTVRESRANAH